MTNSSAKMKTGRFRLRICLVAMFFGVAFVMLVLLPFLGWRESVRRRAYHEHLKAVTVALYQYWGENKGFPPAYTLGPDQRPWHSWRVLLLPYLGEHELYAEYRFDEPWDGPHNRELQHKRPAAYCSPLHAGSDDSVTSYFAIVSRRSAWPAYFHCRFGKGNDRYGSLLLVEKGGSDTIWTEPRDMSEDDFVNRAVTVVEDTLAGKPTDEMIFSDTNLPLPMSMRLRAWKLRDENGKFDREMFIRSTRSYITAYFNRNVIENDEWPPKLLVEEPPCASEPLVFDQSRKLSATRVVATMDHRLSPNENVLYVAGIQDAWNRLRPNDDGAVAVVDETPITRSLNAGSQETPSIPADVVTVRVLDSDENDTADAMREFARAYPGSPGSDVGVQGLRFLISLKLPLSHPEAMQRLDNGLRFPRGEAGMVKCFGSPSIPHPPDYRPGSGRERLKLQSSIDLCDCVSDDDFVLRLISTAGPGVEIVLAKVTPEETLASTWTKVATRADKRIRPADDGKLREIDEIQIPVLSFGFASSFDELKGTKIVDDKNVVREVVGCSQAIQIRLDGCGSEIAPDEYEPDYDGVKQRYNSDPPRRFIFDQPFLMAVRVWRTEAPFFVAWIANSELMREANTAEGRQ